MTHQLAFDLPAKDALTRAEFFVSPVNALALTGIILVVCVLASGLGVRAALKVDPATALGG